MTDVPSPGEFGRAFQRFLQASLALAPREEPEVTRRLREHLGAERIDELPILKRELDRSDHPNLQVALDRLVASGEWTAEVLGLRSPHHYMYGHDDVGGFVAFAGGFDHDSRPGPAIAAPEHVTIPLGAGESIACAVNVLVLLGAGDRKLAALIRRGENRMGQPSLRLEVIARERADAERLLADIDALMREHNVYRGRVLAYAGDLEMGASLEVRVLPAIDRAAIVLPDGTLERIERHALGPVRHRERLLAAGRHLKRGLLLHGPPGTGKTLTAMYLIARMEGRTTVLLTGDALGLIGPACALARALQPATVVLEDVDLVARGRDFDMPSRPLLFELLNEMDGLAEDADVLFLLTTNRPDVLEPALAARPGRIDQTVELPLPDAEGRRRLVELYGAGLDVRADRLDGVVERLEGASPAHVKELLRKAALLAAEETDGPIAVRDHHLEAALEELAIVAADAREALFGEPPGAEDYPFP